METTMGTMTLMKEMTLVSRWAAASAKELAQE
jgi:hypothetical protein